MQEDFLISLASIEDLFILVNTLTFMHWSHITTLEYIGNIPDVNNIEINNEASEHLLNSLAKDDENK